MQIICVFHTQKGVDAYQTQCDPYQITKDIFRRTRTKYFKVYLEAQKTKKSQSNPEKERQLEESGTLI